MPKNLALRATRYNRLLHYPDLPAHRYAVAYVDVPTSSYTRLKSGNSPDKYAVIKTVNEFSYVIRESDAKLSELSTVASIGRPLDGSKEGCNYPPETIHGNERRSDLYAAFSPYGCAAKVAEFKADNKDFLIRKAFLEAQESGFDIGTELAELNEIPGVLNDTMTRAHNALRITRFTFLKDHKSKLGKKRALAMWYRFLGHSIKDLPSNWLAYRYGIMPLIYGVRDLVEYVQSEQYNADKTRVSRGFASLKSEKESLTKEDVILQIVQPSLCQSTDDSEDVFADVWNMQEAYSLSEKVSVGLESLWENTDNLIWNVPGVAWELLKFSFIVDWFIDIGQQVKYSGYAYARATNKNGWCSYTTSNKAVRTTSVQVKVAYASCPDRPDFCFRSAPSVVQESTSKIVTSEKLMNRSSEKLPSSFGIPTITVKMNWKRYADVMALLVPYGLRAKKKFIRSQRAKKLHKKMSEQNLSAP